MPWAASRSALRQPYGELEVSALPARPSASVERHGPQRSVWRNWSRRPAWRAARRSVQVGAVTKSACGSHIAPVAPRRARARRSRTGAQHRARSVRPAVVRACASGNDVSASRLCSSRWLDRRRRSDQQLSGQRPDRRARAELRTPDRRDCRPLPASWPRGNAGWPTARSELRGRSRLRRSRVRRWPTRARPLSRWNSVGGEGLGGERSRVPAAWPISVAHRIAWPDGCDEGGRRRSEPVRLVPVAAHLLASSRSRRTSVLLRRGPTAGGRQSSRGWTSAGAVAS